jgi:predicted phage terminase large subunit-like protein
VADQLEQALARALGNRGQALRFLDQLASERSLLSFIRMMWPVLEPGRPFIDGWVVRAVCEHLEAVSKGQIRRLLINIPPGCMKSLSLVFWPAWEWGPMNRPDLRYVCASYSEALTIRDNRKTRMLIESPLYQACWGDRFALSQDQSAKVRFENSRTGFKLATSVGGVGTGERGDRFIIDDPHNVREGESELKRESVLQWFTEVVSTRVNDVSSSASIIIMQRVHERDVSGLILSKEMGYTHLCLPMEYEPDRRCSTSVGFSDPRTQPGELLWPERFPPAALEQLKADMSAWGGSYAVAGQLQQRPAPRGGGMFQRKDFHVVDFPAPPGSRRVRGWDLAATRDGHGAYTVGARMARTLEGRTVIEDVRRIRGSPGEVQALIRQCSETDPPGTEQSIPQDPGQAGVSQKEAIAAMLAGRLVHFSPETGSKEDRARPLAAQAEAGMVDMVKGSWNDALVNECTSFPAGEFMDQVDALSRAFARLTSQRPLTASSIPATIL